VYVLHRAYECIDRKAFILLQSLQRKMSAMNKESSCSHLQFTCSICIGVTEMEYSQEVHVTGLLCISREATYCKKFVFYFDVCGATV